MVTLNNVYFLCKMQCFHKLLLRSENLNRHRICIVRSGDQIHIYLLVIIIRLIFYTRNEISKLEAYLGVWRSKGLESLLIRMDSPSPTY